MDPEATFQHEAELAATLDVLDKAVVRS